MENSGHRLSISQVYQLAHEYRDHAYSVASKISSEEELKQYYTLINMSIRMFQMLKGKCTLSVVEDSKITFEMVELLIHETHNFDLAELYISSLKERLQTHQNSMCVVEEVMHCEFLLVHDLPLMRDTKFHYKIALRNCNELVQYMTSLKDEVYQNWALVFQYVGVALCIKLKQHRRVKTSFAGLLSQCGDKSQWKWFLNLCYVNYLLNERFPIPEAAIEELRSTELDTVGPRLYAWKLALNMVIQVYKDGNITEHLNEFKRFFDVNKQSLVNDEDKGCMISIAPGVTLKVDLPIIFHYKELKNILLLLQSVSYIVNCYDGKGNFSRKFLPKVHSTTQKLMKTIGTGGVSMNELDSRVQTYKSILDFCDFYKVWEEILLNGAVVEAAAASSSSSSSSNLGPSPAYTKLLQAMKVQFQGGGGVEEYTRLAQSGGTSSEVKMISLLNCYTVQAAKVSRCPGDKQAQLVEQCNKVWQQVERLLRETDLQFNPIWECTVMILWLFSHFEPFSWNPLPCSDKERAEYMSKLREFYSSNKFASGGGAVDERFKLKKALLLQVLVNYLGGRMLEHDLEEIRGISGKCFDMCRHQGGMDKVQYVVGIWHLMNCTVGMRGKDVALTNAKLEALVKQITSGEQSKAKK
ncbi:cohesin-loading factor complex subunit scc4 [Saccharomyces pastorianus]|uniref:Cohesin-loading factor complex subunit scc4 n=1 Tax=Saccharomyces pastorianus TaxID=27292 RepID=A0A6C1E5U4_SACPS|nr:cohesin-loading factor complex subunit scc4 [Saccharomyces pastorianus]